MATAKQLFSAYPTITHAVSYVELIACTPDEDRPVTLWNTLIGLGLAPDEVAKFLLESIQEEAELTGKKFALAAEEAKKPEFLTYIAGKMGAV